MSENVPLNTYTYSQEKFKHNIGHDILIE